VVGRHLEPFGLHRGARQVGSESRSGGGQASPPPCFNPGAVCARCNLGNPRTRRKSGLWNCQSKFSARFSGRAQTVPAFRFRSIDPFGIQPEESGPVQFSRPHLIILARHRFIEFRARAFHQLECRLRPRLLLGKRLWFMLSRRINLEVRPRTRPACVRTPPTQRRAYGT